MKIKVIILSVIFYIYLTYISELDNVWDTHVLLRDFMIFNMGLSLIHISKQISWEKNESHFHTYLKYVYVPFVIYSMIGSIRAYQFFGEELIYGKERSIPLLAVMAFLSVINYLYYRRKRVKENS